MVSPLGLRACSGASRSRSGPRSCCSRNRYLVTEGSAAGFRRIARERSGVPLAQTHRRENPRVASPLASCLPSASVGTPQPSRISSSASARLQLASNRLWNSAASIAPRSRARREWECAPRVAARERERRGAARERSVQVPALPPRTSRAAPGRRNQSRLAAELGPPPRRSAGLEKLRGRPLDHGQWRRRGRGYVSCPVRQAAPDALPLIPTSRQVARIPAGLATYDLEWLTISSEDRGSQVPGLQETHDNILHP